VKNNTFYSYSFGCRVNEAEKEEIDRQMAKKGFVFDEKNPNIFIINTCSVTHKAEREARQFIYQTRKKFPKTNIVVTGCSATYWLKNKSNKNLPIDLIIDNINKKYLVDLLLKKYGQSVKNSTPSLKSIKSNKFVGSGRVMIKIQDGCQRFCTFCVVPYLRGLPNSEKIRNIESRINALGNNVKEVILTAINTEAFGYDSGEKLVDLIDTLIRNTTIPRISFGSIHPWSINDDFLNCYKKVLLQKRLVDFFHVPLQSGSDKILSLMKRGYKKSELGEKLIHLHKINPNALIATDVIVGFLEEEDKDFNDTYEFLEKSPISKFHIFRFSRRDKTAADYMAKRLSEPTSAEKTKRAKTLIDLGRKKYEIFQIKNIGRISSALFLEKEKDGLQEALLDNQLPIFFPIKSKNRSIPGAIKNVKIIEFKNGRLFGKIV